MKKLGFDHTGKIGFVSKLRRKKSRFEKGKSEKSQTKKFEKIIAFHFRGKLRKIRKVFESKDSMKTQFVSRT